MPKAKDFSRLNTKDFDAADVAYLIGVSDRRVREMVASGKLHAEKMQPKMLFDLPSVIKEYIAFKETDGTDPLKAAKIEQTKADTRLKESKAEMAKIELEEFKGQMHRAEDIEAITNDLIYEVRATILSLPSRLAIDIAKLTTPRECSGRIRQECNKALEELAKFKYDPKAYAKKVRERERMKELEEEEYIEKIRSSSGNGRRRSRKPSKDDFEES